MKLKKAITEEYTAKQIDFQNMVVDMFYSIGIISVTEGNYSFEIETTAGKMWASIKESDVDQKNTIYSIYYKYDNKEKAQEKFGCSMETGKNGKHIDSRDKTALEAFKIIESLIIEMLPEENYKKYHREKKIKR